MFFFHFFYSRILALAEASAASRCCEGVEVRGCGNNNFADVSKSNDGDVSEPSLTVIMPAHSLTLVSLILIMLTSLIVVILTSLTVITLTLILSSLISMILSIQFFLNADIFTIFFSIFFSFKLKSRKRNKECVATAKVQKNNSNEIIRSTSGIRMISIWVCPRVFIGIIQRRIGQFSIWKMLYINHSWLYHTNSIRSKKSFQIHFSQWLQFYECPFVDGFNCFLLLLPV